MKKYLIIISIALFVSKTNASLLFSFQDQSRKKEIADTLKKSIKPFADSSQTVKGDSTKKIPLHQLKSIELPEILESHDIGYKINRNDFIRKDYRSSFSLLGYLPFSYHRELGSLGQPTEILFYGLGFNNTSLLIDGININNRLTNSYDMNFLQSEGVNSIEVIPLVRGFLYGINNNSTAININANKYHTDKPFTKIKFYQAPNDEGLFDGIFSASFSERLSTFAEITHQSTLPRYDNTDLSFWQVSLNTRYILSSTWNLIGNYNYSKSITELFGGVDADKILANNTPDQFDEILYDNILAPVRYNYRYQKDSGNLFDLRLLGNITQNAQSDFTFYYNSSLTEYRQNETDSANIQKNYDSIFHNNEFNNFGFRFRQDLNFGIVNLTSITELEKTDIVTPLLIEEKSGTNFSTSAKISSILPDSIGQISAFGKYSKYFGENFSGIGADVVLRLSNSFSAYLGFSNFQKPKSLFVNEAAFITTELNKTENITPIEIKLNYTDNSINLSFGYFSQAYKDKLISTTVIKDTIKNDEVFFFKSKDLSVNGINFTAELKIWKINFNTNTSFYFDDNSRKEFGLPQLTSSGGVYYIDTLFNSNLDLKAGFNYCFYGKRNGVVFDFERSLSATYSLFMSPRIRSYPALMTEEFESDFQIDFFLAGTIQENATIYFVFENLFNNQYFVVPYYPQRERGIRFGVSWEFFD